MKTEIKHPDGSLKEVRTTKHLKLLSKTVDIGEFMETYREKLAYYVYHDSYVRVTSAVRLERLGFSPGEISLIMD